MVRVLVYNIVLIHDFHHLKSVLLFSELVVHTVLAFPPVSHPQLYYIHSPRHSEHAYFEHTDFHTSTWTKLWARAQCCTYNTFAKSWSQCQWVSACASSIQGIAKRISLGHPRVNQRLSKGRPVYPYWCERVKWQAKKSKTPLKRVKHFNHPKYIDTNDTTYLFTNTDTNH